MSLAARREHGLGVGFRKDLLQLGAAGSYEQGRHRYGEGLRSVGREAMRRPARPTLVNLERRKLRRDSWRTATHVCPNHEGEVKWAVDVEGGLSSLAERWRRRVVWI